MADFELALLIFGSLIIPYLNKIVACVIYIFKICRLQAFFSLPTILHHAASTENWQVAAELSQMSGDHVQALGYSLRELEMGSKTDHKSQEEKIVATVKKYIR